MLILASQGLSSWHQKPIQKSCFSKYFPGHPSLRFILILHENDGCWDRFKFQSKHLKFHRCQNMHDFFHRCRVLFATCFFKALQTPPCTFWTDLGPHLATFLIDVGLHFIQIRFPLGSFWKGVAVKVGLVKMGWWKSRRDKNSLYGEMDRKPRIQCPNTDRRPSLRFRKSKPTLALW